MSPAPALPPALPGERFEFDGGSAGRLSCYVAGQGAPLLLLHSVNAAGSAAEVRPLYEHGLTRRTVYALDLPGFGFSERSDRHYTPRLMTDAVLAVLATMRQRHGVAPVDALAVSLGCEFLARAAVEQPAAWRRLALVSPTGFRGTRERRGPAASAVGPAWVGALLRGPGRGPGSGSGWGGPLFRALTRPGVIRHFLQRTWGGKAIDEDLWRYDVLTTRQPGAEHAPLCFLGAALFAADISTLYDQLTQPVWMTHGTRGDFTDYRGTRLVAGRPNWRIEVFEGGALPYFEQPARFNAALDAFLA